MNCFECQLEWKQTRTLFPCRNKDNISEMVVKTKRSNCPFSQNKKHKNNYLLGWCQLKI